MDGFTVSNANRFLDTGRIQVGENRHSDFKSPNIGGTADTQKSFADTLNEAINSVNSLQQDSDKAIQNLATGRTDDVASVMIATEKADIALKLMVQVRNKIIDAYQEVMKMQV
jgi:flagellar hook-basal body complex protein FliE